MKTINFIIKDESRVKHKLEKFINVYSNEIKKKINELTITRYPKFNNQFQGSFNIKILETEHEKIIYEMLSIANKLWHSGSLNWIFNGPHINEGYITFECFLKNHNDDQPIKWAHLELINSNSNGE